MYWEGLVFWKKYECFALHLLHRLNAVSFVGISCPDFKKFLSGYLSEGRSLAEVLARQLSRGMFLWKQEEKIFLNHPYSFFFLLGYIFFKRCRLLFKATDLFYLLIYRSFVLVNDAITAHHRNS